MFRRFAVFLMVSSGLALLAFAGYGCSTSTSDLTFISTVTNGHDHSVTISGPNIDNPPAGTTTIETTEGGAIPHTHFITLSQTDYQKIKDDELVAATTSVTENHTHVFALQKGNEVPATGGGSGGSGY